ncbi:MAG: cache domain-containing protein [Pseudomonadota bacterium]
MKKFFYPLFFAVVLIFALGTTGITDELTNEQVTALVDQVAAEIEKDAKGTFEKIINGGHPYRNKDNEELYAFVYNENVEIVAHVTKSLVGRSYKGKPDVKGKKFRDEIVEGALKNGTGWVDYAYQKPGEKGIHNKTTYYKLVTGNDGTKYVVCSGKYL